MGNSSTKKRSIDQDSRRKRYFYREGQSYSSQFSLSNFVGNLSGRSLLSFTSNQSAYSASRPWSRVSRRRWQEATLRDPLSASRTAWPVPHIESIFLPEFKIATDVHDRKFKLLENIAKGAFGHVYKVEKQLTGEIYALKVLSKSQVISEGAVQQVKEEARIQEACGHHIFIVGAVLRWQTKKRLYIVTEYIPGGELLTLLESYNCLPEELARIYIAELALALDFLHNAGVIYRDLKPENILVDGDGHVLVTDFGLSKWLNIGARTTTICGTLNYMAPEILSREPYGHAVDWWALGVVACRMMTNKYPTSAIANNEAENEDEDGATCGPRKPGSLPPEAADLSAGAKKLLISLLEVEPRYRLRSIIQLQNSAFFLNFSIQDVKMKKISPKEIMNNCFPDGPPSKIEEVHLDIDPDTMQIFSQFEGLLV